MKKILVIAVYFGPFPKHHNLFVRSISKNPTIDFKIFTDQDAKSNISNLEYIKITFSQLNGLVKSKLGSEFAISKPYKCCDFKPIYGVLFEDYCRGYDFWGHCDLDVIFGNIRKFITNDILEKYDKILPLGHLGLYRNNNEVNNRFRDDGSKFGDYKKIFSTEENVAFDELGGIGQIYYRHGYSFYDKRIFADISVLRNRFTLAMGDKNYKKQIFYWEDGHVYRAYELNGNIEKDEFIYIHFKQRKYLDDLTENRNVDSFYICNFGFIQKKKGIPTLNDIDKYNKNYGWLYEKIETRHAKNKLILERCNKKVKKMITRKERAK